MYSESHSPRDFVPIEWIPGWVAIGYYNGLPDAQDHSSPKRKPKQRLGVPEQPDRIMMELMYM